MLATETDLIREFGLTKDQVRRLDVVGSYSESKGSMHALYQVEQARKLRNREVVE